ncbi:MAG: Gfo/Idh/MocA family oxidoreductase [Ruminococcaceae bacterium]|nr:Gfo/Idh/MocA family oxidoreductase [Oscillospiraceae bacterium]
MKKTVKFAIIGCGLMGREFASASARWCHLKEDIARPEIVAVCDISADARKWFVDNFPTVKFETSDYHEILAMPEVEAVYCALPHNMHEQVYCDIIRAKKHLLGEKPFGIDKAANEAILKVIDENPDVIVRCASEFPYFPACQELIRWIESGKLGRILEVKAGFNHASDLDITKPINWKRTVKMNGVYGCLGDLGIHTQHVPFRMGWIPKRVYAVLSDIVKERPDGKGGMAVCDTYDNGTMICTCEDKDGNEFAMYLETKRMAPSATNDWYIEVTGLNASVKFSTNTPNTFHYLFSEGKNQAWSSVVIGTKPMIPTITGDIFEFGFTDAILQMWASFMCELEGKQVYFGCFTPEETRFSHALHTASLISHNEKRAVSLSEV